MAAFFTADTHFGDPHILRRRCWAASVADHDEQLIAGWNDRVGPMDEVWHLGDFAAGASRMRCAEIFARLNGTKRLIRGNHDTNRVLNLPWAEAPVECARISVWEAFGAEHGLYLAPYAHRSWPGLWREFATCTATRTQPCRTRAGPAMWAWTLGIAGPCRWTRSSRAKTEQRSGPRNLRGARQAGSLN